MYMAKLASRNGDDPNVKYGDLAAVVQRKESMEFLHDILPKKVRYSESTWLQRWLMLIVLNISILEFTQHESMDLLSKSNFPF